MGGVRSDHVVIGDVVNAMWEHLRLGLSTCDWILRSCGNRAIHMSAIVSFARQKKKNQTQGGRRNARKISGSLYIYCMASYQ